METKLELLGKATVSTQLNSETVGLVANIVGKTGKLEIPASSISNGKDRMVCYLTTEAGARHKAIISAKVTADLRTKAIGRADLGWCEVQLTELAGGENVLFVTYPQGTGAVIEVGAGALKATGTRPAVEFDDSLLAM